jgi:hypothetical protein
MSAGAAPLAGAWPGPRPSVTLAAMPDRPRLIAWVERGQEKLLTDAIEEARMTLTAIGSPSSATADAMSKSLDAARVDDLRQAIQQEEAELLWLVAPERIAADERRLIREVGRRTVSSEPRPVAIADLMMNPQEADTAHFVPLFRRSPGYRGAMDAVGELAPPQCVIVSFVCGAGEGTLFARLFDAMDVLEALCGEVEGIDAALAGPLAGVPDSLENLHGHMTINVRFADNCCAGVSVSDCAGSWHRQAILLGGKGRLRITDTGDESFGADGRLISAHHDERPLTPGILVGMDITRRLENRAAPATAPPPNTARLLALCEAALLSCRTKQSEAPGKLLEMLSKP